MDISFIVGAGAFLLSWVAHGWFGEHVLKIKSFPFIMVWGASVYVFSDWFSSFFTSLGV